MSIKILLVSPQMEKSNGGIAIWTNTYLEGCENTEIEPVLVNTSAIGKRAKNGNAKRNFFDEIIRTKRIFRDLKSKLNAQSFDVAHINTSCGSFGLIRDYLIAKKIKKTNPKTKIIVHYHCDVPYQIKKRTSKKHLEKLLRLSDKSFVLCENSSRYLKENFSVDSIKVPNFVNEKLISEKGKNTNGDIKKAFFVGRVSLAKGAKEIYEIARRFPNIKFELAGNVSTTVMEWQKPDNIILLGLLSHDEVLLKMDEADIFLFPTYSEGFSMALAEAMSRGLPAIATDVGANADMLENKGGTVVRVGDVDAMQKAIQTMGDGQTRAKMSEWTLNKVRNKYVTDVVINLFVSEYKTF